TAPGLPTWAMIANRRRSGTTSRNSSRRLPARSVDWSDRPVMLPPGRDRLATKPLPTGSFATANTIGMTDVACFAARSAVPDVTMTSTFSWTSSAAISTNRSSRPSAQRSSPRMVRPSIQPKSRNRCTKAATHWLQAEGVVVPRNPMVGSFPACCARATSGHAAAPPRSEMNSRRCVSTLAEFIAYAKVNQKKMQFGSAGAGSINQMACVLLTIAMGTNITQVPYRGNALALQDLIGGRIDFMCDSLVTALPQIQQNTVKAIANLTPSRASRLPNLATAREQG